MADPSMPPNQQQQLHDLSLAFGVIYSCIAAVILLFLCLIILRTPWRERVPQKMFYLSALAGLLGRIAFFFLSSMNTETVQLNQAAFSIINYYPSFCFFSMYSILLYLWMKIVHHVYQNTALTQRLYRAGFIVFNLLLYAAFVGIIIGISYVDTTHYNPFPVSALPGQMLVDGLSCLEAAIFATTAIAFTFYGVGLYYKVRNQHALKDDLRAAMLVQAGLIAGVVSACYLTRAILIIYGNIYNRSFSTSVSPIACYYVFLELLPLVLMVVVLRRKGFSVPRDPNRHPVNESRRERRPLVSATGLQ